MTLATDILINRDGDVTTITLNRPDKFNSITAEMIVALPAMLTEAVADGARAIVLTGTGRAFSSGAEIVAVPDGLPDAGERMALYNVLAATIADLPVPFVTAVNGAAAGGGASIALAGDIVIAARSAYLMLAFSRIALVPDLGATWLVAQSAGRLKALEMALLGDKVPAEEAFRVGLVTRVVDDEQLMAEAMAVARRLAAMPTVTLGLIRKQVRAAFESGFSAALALESDFQARSTDTEDFREGIQAFREKRAPAFIGR